MNVKPIPMELLTDSVTLLTPTGSGYSRQELENVRVIRTSVVTDHLVTHTRERSELVVYFDCVNSTPEGTEFEAGQQLLYHGETYCIIEAALFAAESPHHYRITCRKLNGEYIG